MVDPCEAAGEQPVVSLREAILWGNDSGWSDMGAEFFDQMPVKAGLEFSLECFKVLACSIHAQALIVEGEGEDEDFVGSDARRIGACLADVVDAHGGAGCEAD